MTAGKLSEDLLGKIKNLTQQQRRQLLTYLRYLKDIEDTQLPTQAFYPKTQKEDR